MPQSFACLHYHLIFSTKHRQPLLTPEISERLFAYIGGILRNHKGTLLAAGGMPDHVHLLAGISKEMSISEAMRIIKANSSGWIHETFLGQQCFAWQEGYGAFTVSYSLMDTVRDYIARQEEHHRVKTFQEEFLAFLQRHGLEYDEKYIWD